MEKSIIQSNKSVCYVCGAVSPNSLECHHMLKGTANRKLADEDGLFVWLCPDCHRGTFGVHGSKGHEVDLRLKRIAQRAWEHEFAVDAFIDRYGKSWI